MATESGRERGTHFLKSTERRSSQDSERKRAREVLTSWRAQGVGQVSDGESLRVSEAHSPT